MSADLKENPAAALGAKQSFLPKQAMPTNGHTYSKGSEVFTIPLASQLVSKILPLNPDSIVHDNGCGSGAATHAIMASNPPAGIKIHASDISPGMTGVLEETAKEKNWPVEVRSGVDYAAQKLGYEDNMFTHSVSSLVVQYTPNDGLDAGKEIYRTLKPGGKAVANCFKDIPHWAPFKRTFQAQRGFEFPMGRAMMEDWLSGEKLKRMFVEAGFGEDNVQMLEVTAWMDGGVFEKPWENLAQFMWSSMGAIGGWKQEDEDKWEESIERLIKELKTIPGLVEYGNGAFKWPVVFHVAVATK